MKKINIVLLLVFGLFMTSFTRKAKAYEFGNNSPYISINVQGMGQIKLYVSSNQMGYVQIQEETKKIINDSGSTINFYTNDSSYTWSITNYDSLRYRINNQASYIYPSYEVIDTNISSGFGSMNYFYKNKDMIMISLEFIIAMGVMLRWLKH